MSKHIQKVKATPLMVKLAKEASEDIQMACNGCGLAQSFGQVFKHVLSFTDSTAAANQHPIIVAWIDKFCSLARMEQGTNYDAWRKLEKLAAGEDIEYEVIG